MRSLRNLALVIGTVTLASFGAPTESTAQAGPTVPTLAVVVQSIPAQEINQDPLWSALLDELALLGWAEGSTIVIDRWSTEGRVDASLDEFAKVVVSTEPDVIVTSGRRVMAALKNATSSIPIVGSGTLTGIIDSMSRPGGNLTGLDTSYDGATFIREMQFLREVALEDKQFAYLGRRDRWEDPAIGGVARTAAAELGQSLGPVLLETPITELAIRRAFSEVSEGGFDALYILSDPTLQPFSGLIGALALQAGIPAIATSREYVEAGVLMGYLKGGDAASRRRLAHYVDRVLRGEDPAEMPVEGPTEFEFVVNLKSAAALGLTLPPYIVLFATEFIE
jgi:putative ABC transport system substrate-binding protein